MPTETVYGLAGSIDHPEAIAEIFRRKGRPQDNPLIVHVASFEQAYALTTPEGAKVIDTLGRWLWPGPLTIVVPCSDQVPSEVSAGLDTVAIRMPSHQVLRDLITEAESPLAAPSANVSGRPSPTRAEHVRDDLGDEVFVLDGGPCEHGIESTVVQVIDGGLYVLRPGAISSRELENLDTGLAVHAASEPEHSVARSPGMKYRHYAPDAHIILCNTVHEVNEYLRSASELPLLLVPPGMEEAFSQCERRPLTTTTLFDELRRADSLQTETIVVLCDDSVRSNEALMNRLLKAAGIDRKGQ